MSDSAAAMAYSRFKRGCFALEGINALATAYYQYYLFFILQSQHGFGDLQNLLVSALNGFVYTFAPLFAGRFAQRRGYFRAVRLGTAILLVMMLVGTQVNSAAGQVAILAVWTFGVSFTWPSLEALASEFEPPRRLPQTVGIYNLVWAAGAALAYFSGGALLEKLGPTSIFLVPAVLHLTQWLMFPRLQRAESTETVPQATPVVTEDSAGTPRPAPDRTRMFLRLAWIANPFAYMAISTLVPLIPGLAERHELTPMWAGFFCSTWFFGRLGAFLLLWLWEGWHYRFRWLAVAFVLLALGFTSTLLARTLWLVIVAQAVFGISCGFMYYSSLFYSMDAGDTKGEHGGIHEAAIGAGIFAGPVVGAAGLWLVPQSPHAATVAVAALLGVGFVVLLGLKWHWGRSSIARTNASSNR